MAVGGINKWTPPKKSGGISTGSTRDEQADAGRDCRTRLARPNSQARTEIRKKKKNVQQTTSRIRNLTRLIHTLL